MMATMRCDHRDIEAFVTAKSDAARLRNFYLSVLITDPFMQAVADGASWELVFDGTVYRTVQARDLWNRIMRATYDHAEPGVIFIDRINAMNNLAYWRGYFGHQSVRRATFAALWRLFCWARSIWRAW